MALKAIVKKTIQRGLAVPQWVDYTQWKRIGQSFLGLVRHRLARPATPPQAAPSFTHVMQQFQLSEDDLSQRQKQFQRLMKLWLGLFVLTFAYGFYLALLAAWLSMISVLVLSLITLCQAFQYHFWSFQIRQRRLDATLEEWWKFTTHRRWFG